MPNLKTGTGGGGATQAGTTPLNSSVTLNATSPIRIDGGDSARLSANPTLTLDVGALGELLTSDDYALLSAGTAPVPQVFTGHNRFSQPLRIASLQVSGQQVAYAPIYARVQSPAYRYVTSGEVGGQLTTRTSAAGATRTSKPYETLVYLSGGRVTVTGLCPTGGWVESLTGYLVSGIMGCPYWQLGLEDSQDAWGRALPSGQGTRTSHRDWRLRGVPLRTAPTNFTVTASGGGYSLGQGVARITSWVVEFEGATS